MNHANKPPAPDAPLHPVIKWIMAVVALWGAILAAGVYFYVDPVLVRIRPAAAAVIVLACTTGFVVLWWLLLAARGRRERKRLRHRRGENQDDRGGDAP